MSCGCSGSSAPGAATAAQPRPRDLARFAVIGAAAWAIVKGEWGALLLIVGAAFAYRHFTAGAAPASATPTVTWQNSPPDSTGLYGGNVSGVASDTVTVQGLSQTISGDC